MTENELFITRKIMFNIKLWTEGIIVGQIGAKKDDHNAAYCNEELRFGIVMEEAMKSETGHRARYYLS